MKWSLLKNDSVGKQKVPDTDICFGHTHFLNQWSIIDWSMRQNWIEASPQRKWITEFRSLKFVTCCWCEILSLKMWRKYPEISSHKASSRIFKKGSYELKCYSLYFLAVKTLDVDFGKSLFLWRKCWEIVYAKVTKK